MTPLDDTPIVRKVTINEFDSSVVLVRINAQGQIVLAPKFLSPGPNDFLYGPTVSKLGTLGRDGFSKAFDFADRITENPAQGSTEIWEIYNFTADAHPIHIHEVTFEVINRQDLVAGPDGLAAQPARLVTGNREARMHMRRG